MAASSIRDRLLGLVAITLTFCVFAGCGQEPAVIILEYEVDREEIDGETPVDMDRLVKAINTRLFVLGLAGVSEAGNIKVVLHGGVGEGELNKIKRRLTTRGLLEFRITASPIFKDHRAIIDLAKKLPPDESEVWLGESKVAEWIAYKVEEFGPVDEMHGIDEQGKFIKRMAGDAPQALILTNDGLDVTSEFLKKSTSDLDERGRPQINFSFNQLGAFRFGRLTGQHIPNSSGQTHHLGIILDKKLLSAPSIQSKITSHGRITGSMGQQEVDFIVGILNAGSLPYPIRQVPQ